MIFTLSSCDKLSSSSIFLLRAASWLRIPLCLAFSCIVYSAQNQADTVDIFNWKTHGFVNQGYIKTDHNQFFGDSENGSWEFTDIGVGASTKLTNSLQISAQALYRRAGKTSPDGVQLDYMLVDWSAINHAEVGLGLRAGRIKNPFGFYNETRDVATSRPSILLPESIYVDALREVFHTSDGIGLYAYKSWDNTLLTFDTAFGQPIISRTTQDVIITVPLPGELQDEQLSMSRIMLEEHSGRWRIAYSHGDFKGDYEPASVDLAVSGSTPMTLKLLSLEYNWGKWQFSSEHLQREINYSGISGDDFKFKLESSAYYAQASYRVNPQWQWLLRYDRLYTDTNDKEGKTFTISADAYAKDWTAGARFQPNSQWLLSAELHKINGTAWLPRVENPLTREQHSRWLLFTAQVSWRF